MGLRQRAPTAIIVAHGTDKSNLVPKPRCLHREVERRAPQPFAVREHIPKNFSHNDKSHADNHYAVRVADSLAAVEPR